MRRRSNTPAASASPIRSCANSRACKQSTQRQILRRATMALLADDAAHRVEQLILLSERLSALVAQEAERMEARLPLLEGAEAEEKNRLANAYRLELARVQQDPELIKTAPKPLLDALKKRTLGLNQALARHETALNAVKLISEGL